jgi:hypothetical protein
VLIGVRLTSIQRYVLATLLIVSFPSGDPEVFKTTNAVKKRVEHGGVVTIKKGYAISMFNKTNKRFDELEPKKWTDVTSSYL